MCGHEEEGAGVPRTIELEPGEVLLVFGRIPGQQPTSLFEINWDLDENGDAASAVYELSEADGHGLSLINEWQVEV